MPDELEFKTSALKFKAGDTFGKWTILARDPIRRHGQIHWICSCACGSVYSVSGSLLNRGKSRQCLGCNHRLHGYTSGGKISPEYAAWNAMRTRCCNPNYHGSKDYGGRGITVCARWMKFKNFIKDMGRRPSPQHSLGRINNDKGYSRSNCRWETIVEQNRNKRSVKLYRWKGKELCAAELARLPEARVVRKNLSRRLRKGWSVEKAVTESPTRRPSERR